jgi:hypothetical protein
MKMWVGIVFAAIFGVSSSAQALEWPDCPSAATGLDLAARRFMKELPKITDFRLEYAFSQWMQAVRGGPVVGRLSRRDVRALQGRALVRPLYRSSTQALFETSENLARELTRSEPGFSEFAFDLRETDWKDVVLSYDEAAKLEAFQCLYPADQLQVLGQGRAEFLPVTTKRVLKRAEAFKEDEENLWGDTILEGDYFQTGPAQVREVQAIRLNGTTVAYAVEITARAIDTSGSDCRYNDERERYEGTCLPGTFRVTKYLDLDLEEIPSDFTVEFEQD